MKDLSTLLAHLPTGATMLTQVRDAIYYAVRNEKGHSVIHTTENDQVWNPEIYPGCTGLMPSSYNQNLDIVACIFWRTPTITQIYNPTLSAITSDHHNLPIRVLFPGSDEYYFFSSPAIERLHEGICYLIAGKAEIAKKSIRDSWYPALQLTGVTCTITRDEVLLETKNPPKEFGSYFKSIGRVTPGESNLFICQRKLFERDEHGKTIYSVYSIDEINYCEKVISPRGAFQSIMTAGSNRYLVIETLKGFQINAL